MAEVKNLQELAKLVRYYILEMTTKVASGHPTSSLSATDLMVALFFNSLKFDLKNPQNPNNDRVIFSKGHASPLFYALYRVAGVISNKELEGYRRFGSKLEGHPRPVFPYAEAATGSLGQGLSIGLGMALASRLDGISNRNYVLMGDSEMAEGSIWEAMELASYYKVDNLVAVADINRLGQRGPTMLQWDLEKYRARVGAFGWEVHEVNGHDMEEVVRVFDNLPIASGRPQMILAKTIKGRGVPFLENKEGWHGKALGVDELREALLALGEVDKKMVGQIDKPGDRKKLESQSLKFEIPKLMYKVGDMVATRKAYGEALAQVGLSEPRVVVLDGETKNSTYSEIFEEKNADRFFEMFIAEQNMVGTGLGLAKRGKIPFVNTFTAFFTRAFDQIRMSAYSLGNVKFVGSHGGVSIGEDGPSQMGLEDIAMFKTIFGSKVLVPSDAVSAAKLTSVMAKEEGIVYMRTARPATPVIYEIDDSFKVGGSKVVKFSKNDQLLIVACGVCVAEAIKAAEDLAQKKINVAVVDAYSVKPIDETTIRDMASKSGNLIVTVEDHYAEGGLGDSVLNAVATIGNLKVYKLSVSKMPTSGTGDELLQFEGINSTAIVSKVLKILG